MPINFCGCPSDKIRNRPFEPCDKIESYAGAVLYTYESNGYDDSDFHAVVWDDEAGKIKDIEYATTRAWTYHNSATVDATEDVMVKALAAYRQQWADVEIRRERRMADVPRIGSTVRSLTTRGKNVDITGVVRWRGDGRYGESVAIEVAGEDRRRFLPVDRVAVVNPPAVDEADIRRRAQTVNPNGWRLALV